MFRRHFFSIFILLIIALLYCYPIILNLNRPILGIGDWDQAFFYNEVTRITIFSYHQFPLWNPYYCGGMSLIGNPQTSFSPVSFILLGLFGVINGLRMSVIFYLFLGMTGMYLLCHHFAIKGFSALLPAIIFMMSGPYVLHTTEGHLWMRTVAYLPLVFLSFLGGLKQPRFIFIGAILLALMFYEGGIYIVPFTGLFLFLYAAFDSLQKKQINPIVNLMILFFLFFLFSAPKLLPVLELMHGHPRPTSAGVGLSFKYLYDIFIDPKQGFFKIFPPSPRTGWWEYGAYVGFLPAALFLLSLSRVKDKWPLVLTGIIFFLIGLGGSLPYSIWGLLHRLSIFNNMWVPSRAFIFFIFVLSISLGLYLTRFESGYGNQRIFPKLLLAIVFCLITGSLIITHTPVFFHLYRPFRLVSSEFKKYSDFQQVRIDPAVQFRYGGWSAMYPALLDNKGVINGYEPVPFARNAIPVQDRGYRGEIYLLKGQGSCSSRSWSPNVMKVRCKINSPDTLVINQNFDENWKSNASSPVRPYRGLLSVGVAPVDKELIVYYLPSSFLYGLLFFGVGILLSVLTFRGWIPGVCV